MSGLIHLHSSLPWVDFNSETKTFLLEDGLSYGAVLEVEPRGTESLDQASLREMRDAVQVALADALPEDEDNPWILQDLPLR